MDADERRETIIKAAFQISHELGAGFLEKVYENALSHVLRKWGFQVDQQAPITVLYDQVIVGEYVADIVVDDSVLVELKAVKAFDDVYMAQCLNYLKATEFTVCLLLNFGSPRVEVKRIVNNF
jgi:GxxExxY protein